MRARAKLFLLLLLLLLLLLVLLLMLLLLLLVLLVLLLVLLLLLLLSYVCFSRATDPYAPAAATAGRVPSLALGTPARCLRSAPPPPDTPPDTPPLRRQRGDTRATGTGSRVASAPAVVRLWEGDYFPFLCPNSRSGYFSFKGPSGRRWKAVQERVRERGGM